MSRIMSAPNRLQLIEKELTASIIGAFYHVYNQLGYGFLEKIYSEALARTLIRRGHKVEREVRVVIYFEGESVGLQRVDMIVDDRVIVENKSTYLLSEADHRQLTSYVTASEIQVGLLLHFGPKPEFYRFVSTRSPRREPDPGCRLLPP
jgi:GxxExxY protein